MGGQLWVTNSLGGYMSAKNLSKKLRLAVQPLIKFRQLCDVKDATQQGKKKGDVPLPENESVTPAHIVKLRGGLKNNQVREGSF